MLAGLGKWAAERLARKQLKDAREGRKGEDVKNLLAFVDGYKRVILLAAFLVVAWLKAAGVGDYAPAVEVLMRMLDWSPEALPVPAALIASTVAGAFAIVDGVKKALAERRLKDAITRAEIRRFEGR